MKQQRDFYDIIGRLAMWTAPIAAGAFFGWKTWADTMEMTGQLWLAWTAALAAAFTLEAVGMYAGHTMITLKQAGDKRWVFGLLALAIYTGIGGVPLLNTVAFFVFLLVSILYGLYALGHNAKAVQAEAKAERTEDKAWQRRQQEKREERQHQLAMRQIELDARASTEPALPAQAAQSEYECHQCRETFGSQAAVNAHQRWCKAKPVAVSANGSGPKVALNGNGRHG